MRLFQDLLARMQEASAVLQRVIEHTNYHWSPISGKFLQQQGYPVLPSHSGKLHGRQTTISPVLALCQQSSHLKQTKTTLWVRGGYQMGARTDGPGRKGTANICTIHYAFQVPSSRWCNLASTWLTWESNLSHFFLPAASPRWGLE